MTDDELNAHLRGLRVPPPESTAKDRALHRAIVALKHASLNPPAVQTTRAHSGWRWVTAAALIVFTVVLAINRFPTNRGSQAPEILLAEMNALFPDQVNAVIEKDGAVLLDLSEKPDRASEQPVLVEFARAGKVLRILSYSGRRVCVELHGKNICFEPLVTAEGEVILSGEDFLWSTQNPVLAAGYKVHAHFLHPAS